MVVSKKNGHSLFVRRYNCSITVETSVNISQEARDRAAL